MTDREKEMMVFVISCLLDMSDGLDLSTSAQCRLFEYMRELEE